MEQIKDFCKEKYPFIIVFIWAFVASFIGNIFFLFAAEVVLFAFALICGAKLSFDLGDVLLGLGMFFFYYFDGRSIVMSVVLAGEVLIVYQMGKMIVLKESNNRDNVILISVLVLAFVFWLFAVGDYLRVIINPEIYVGEKWDYPFFTQGIPRTQHEFWFVLSSSLLPFFLIENKINIKLRIMGIFVGISGIVLAVYMEGRIAFCIFVLNLIASVVGYIYEKQKRFNSNLILVGVGILIALYVLMMLTLKKNIFGIYDIYKGSMWSGGGGIIHNTRMSLWTRGFERMKMYPFGCVFGEDDWLVAKNGFRSVYAHNSWIDIGVRSGVATFIIVLLFTLFVIYEMVLLFVNYKSFKKYEIILGYMGLALYNFVEPAIYANRVFWFTLILFSGFIVGVNYRIKRKLVIGEINK